MDELLRDFVTETNESLDVVDVELVRFEQDPNNAKILDNVFRLVHTIKGTCGFLELPRLEALAHAAETLMGRFRDGVPATNDAVTLILATIDRIKQILESLEREQREPEGVDADLISDLQRMAERVTSPAAPAPAQYTVGTLTPQVLERPLRPGEDSLDDLERAFRATAVEPPAARPAQPAPADVAAKDDDAAKAAGQSIRVTVDTLEHLMTMVSELVLTRNQLLEIVRRHEDSEFKAPLQRLSNVTAELQEGVMKTRMQPIGNAWQKLPRIVRDLSQRTGQANRPGNAGRRDGARPPGARSDQGSAHPYGAQFGRSRPRSRRSSGARPASRSAAASVCRPITRAAISSSRWPMMAAVSTPIASRPRRSLRAWSPKPMLQSCRKRKFTNSFSRPVFPPLRKSPACPAAASAWTWCATISTRSAAPST